MKIYFQLFFQACSKRLIERLIYRTVCDERLDLIDDCLIVSIFFDGYIIDGGKGLIEDWHFVLSYPLWQTNLYHPK